MISEFGLDSRRIMEYAAFLNPNYIIFIRTSKRRIIIKVVEVFENKF